MIDRSKLMKRAWEIFRETYHYPAVPFRSIGRECFAYALRCAWHEVRQTAVVAISPVERGAMIERLRNECEFLAYREDYRGAALRRFEINAELAQLGA